MKILLTVMRVFLLLLFSGVAFTTPPPVQPLIDSVMADFDSNTLTIYGSDLRNGETIPEVELLGYDGVLVVDELLTTPEMIVTDLPVDVLAGDYRLIVTPTLTPPLFDTYDLTIGAVGPVGPVGPAGADGIDGIDGVDGVDGIDGKDGEDGEDGADGINGVTNIEYVVVEELREAPANTTVSVIALCAEGHFITGGSCWSGSATVINSKTDMQTGVNVGFRCYFRNTTDTTNPSELFKAVAACAAP